MNKIIVTSSGSFGPPKEIIRDEISWIKSAEMESELFEFDKSEIFAAACGSEHSLYKYAKFRSNFIKALFVNDASGIKKKTSSFSIKDFIKNSINNCPSIIYTIPTILKVLCLFIKKYNNKNNFLKVKFIFSGGENWPQGLGALVKHSFPNAKIINFYGAAELGFVGWGEPGKGYKLFPNVQAWCDSSKKIWVESPYLANVNSPASAGDIGWFDANGLLYLTGRLDRKFRVKGTTISPETIEAALKKYPQITRAYVFKRPYKNKEGKVSVVVYVEPCEESFKASPVKELKLLPLAESLKIAIKNTLLENNLQLSFSSLKSINVWPLLASGKTNFKMLESLW